MYCEYVVIRDGKIVQTIRAETAAHAYMQKTESGALYLKVGA